MLFYKLTDGTLELGTSIWEGASMVTTTPPAWPWDSDRNSILEVVPHSDVVLDPEINDYSGMFKNCPNLTSINISNLSLASVLTWATGNSGNNGIAQNCPKLTYFKCARLPATGITYHGGGSGPNGAFKNSCGDSTKLTFDVDMTADDLNISGLFQGCLAKDFVFTKPPKDAANIGATFSSCTNLEELDLTNWKFKENVVLSKVLYTNPAGVFSGCSKLKYLKLPRVIASSWGSSNWGWLNNASTTSKYLHLTIDISRSTSISYFFSNFKGISLIVDGAGITDRCVSADHLFEDCTNLIAIPDLSSWDFSKVTTLNNMCHNCSQLRVVDLSSWDLASVTNMRSLCSNASRVTYVKFKIPAGLTYGSSDSLLSSCSGSAAKLIVELDCENTTTLTRVFRSCSAPAIELTLTNAENISSIEYMFYGCSNLVTIRCDYDLSSCTGAEVFTNDTRLVGGAGTTYDASHKDASYAKIDAGAGYFSALNSTNWIIYVDPAGSGLIKAPGIIDTAANQLVITTTTNLDPLTRIFSVEHQDDVIDFMGWFVDGVKQSTSDSIQFSVPATGTGRTYIVEAKYYVQGTIYENPWEDAGTSAPSGPGTGSWDETSDVIPVGDLPTLSGVSKFTNIYVIDEENLDEVSDYLWSATFEGFWENLWGSPMDYITSLAILPVTPATSGSEAVKVGKFTIDDSSALKVSSRWKRVDLGTINVREFSGSYLDYSPYTRVQIYLPFVGYRDLDVDMFQNGELQVIYDIDCITGDLIAKILTASGGVTSQFQGNCKSELPITGLDNSKLGGALVSGMVMLAAAGAGGAAMAAAGAGGAAASPAPKMSSIVGSNGNFLPSTLPSEAPASSGGGGAVAGGVAAGLAHATGDAVMSSKPSIVHGSSLGATGGLLGTQRPYLIWTIPRVSIPANYTKEHGLPINVRYRLSTLTGFTVCDNVHIPLISDMTKEEAQEIESLLQEGVYL